MIIDNAFDTEVPTFEQTDTKLYVAVVTLSAKDNEKLLQQLKSGFKIKSNNTGTKPIFRLLS